MKIKLHANQLHQIGGVKLGIKQSASSVDHLEYIAKEDIDCLASGNTIATLLPTAAFFLRVIRLHGN